MSKHPAVIKAQRIASLAKDNGWRGKIESHVDRNGCRTTSLEAQRQEEWIYVRWSMNHLEVATYSICDYSIQLGCAARVLDRLEKKPNVIFLLEKLAESPKLKLLFATLNPILRKQIDTIIIKYRNIPFSAVTSTEEQILKSIMGQRITWFSFRAQKIYSEIVSNPRKKSQAFNVRTIDGKRMVSFNTIDTGMRTVYLDSILKVEPVKR